MLETEAFSVAARLYVVMRQKVGRITDVQWMLMNPDYAQEVIRLAREQAGSELPELASRFEAILASRKGAAPAVRRASPVPQPAEQSGAPGRSAAAPAPANEDAPSRYVGRLR